MVPFRYGHRSMAAPPSSWWVGKLKGRKEPNDESLTLDLPFEQGVGGGSGSFWGIASDRQRWRVKPINGAHGEMATVSEFIVGRVGATIAAPVCEVSLIRIPTELAGWEFQNGRALEVGVACASREVVGAHEERALTHRDEDDNRRRHVGVYAIYDWCFGADDQWLYETPADEKVHSHDHGMYLPGSTDWRAQDLQARIQETHVLAAPAVGLDVGAKEDFAQRLESVPRHTLHAALLTVPASWPVADSDLEGLGHFLEARAPLVANRVRSLS